MLRSAALIDEPGLKLTVGPLTSVSLYMCIVSVLAYVSPKVMEVALDAILYCPVVGVPVENTRGLPPLTLTFMSDSFIY